MLGEAGEQKNLSFMSNKKENEELQSRREFFKKAAKAALPVVGAVVLASLPIVKSEAATGCDDGGCYGGCSDGCYGGCQGSCSGGCKNGCKSSCKEVCTGRCLSDCDISCKDGCYITCFMSCQEVVRYH